LRSENRDQYSQITIKGDQSLLRSAFVSKAFFRGATAAEIEEEFNVMLSDARDSSAGASAAPGCLEPWAKSGR
jgi:hypothetical protein